MASTLQVSRSSQLSYGPKLQKTFCKTDSNRNLQRLCSDVLPLNYIAYCVATKGLLYVFLLAHGVGFEPTLGLLRLVNSQDRSASTATRTLVGVVGFEPTQPKQRIYSPSRLSNCGALPYVPTTLFYNYPRESNNLLRKRCGTCTWCGCVINHIFNNANMQILF